MNRKDVKDVEVVDDEDEVDGLEISALANASSEFFKVAHDLSTFLQQKGAMRLVIFNDHAVEYVRIKAIVGGKLDNTSQVLLPQPLIKGGEPGNIMSFGYLMSKYPLSLELNVKRFDEDQLDSITVNIEWSRDNKKNKASISVNENDASAGGFSQLLRVRPQNHEDYEATLLSIGKDTQVCLTRGITIDNPTAKTASGKAKRKGKASRKRTNTR